MSNSLSNMAMNEAIRRSANESMINDFSVNSSTINSGENDLADGCAGAGTANILKTDSIIEIFNRELRRQIDNLY